MLAVRPCGFSVAVRERPSGERMIDCLLVASNVRVNVLPLSVVVSVRDCGDNVFFASETITECVRPMVNVRPDGVFTVAADIVGACMPNRGSAIRCPVIRMLSAVVALIVWSFPIVARMLRPFGAVLVRFVLDVELAYTSMRVTSLFAGVRGTLSCAPKVPARLLVDPGAE